MKIRKSLCFLLVIGALSLLCACSSKTQTQTLRGQNPDSPKETAQYVMNSLKTLNLQAFNDYTDNYVRTNRNWLGVPISREYRVFNELLQPNLIKGKPYQRNLKLSQKLMENLSWEITQVRSSEETAEIDMKITNIDMPTVAGNYVVLLLENMAEGNGPGIGSLIRDLSSLAQNSEDFISVIDSLDSDALSTMSVTLSTWRENGIWKIHVTDEFINAFLGNIDSEEYPPELGQKIEALEREIEDKALLWAEEFEKKAAAFSD